MEHAKRIAARMDCPCGCDDKVQAKRLTADWISGMRADGSIPVRTSKYGQIATYSDYLMRHDWPEDPVATFISWLLSWTFGLLYPIMARWVACGSGNFAGESRDRRHRLLHRARTYTGPTKGCVPSDVTITLTECIAQVNESDRTMQRAEGVVLPNLYYFAVWTDGGYLLGCEHHHQTVISAANCISEAGGYVIAVEKGKLRALNDVEEEMFRLALYGSNAVGRRVLVFKPIRAFKPSLN